MQTAQTLQAENVLLKENLDKNNKIIEQKNHYILQREEALKQQRQKQFGTSSEKTSADQ